MRYDLDEEYGYESDNAFIKEKKPVDTIKQICNDFATKLTALVEAQTLDGVKSRLMAQLGGSNGVHKPSGPIKAVRAAARRKGPIQLCPHPGCKERSAPVYAMMCAKHKNDKKADIKKWRAARLAKKTAK